MSTAYHPQMGGQSERTNQSLEMFIRCYCDEEQDNWHIWLPMAEFAHNQWPNATTKKAPFDLIMGYIPHMGQIKKPSPVPQVEEQLAELEHVRKVAWEAMLKAQAMLQVEIPRRWKIHNVFHTNLLTPYKETELHGPNFTQPPPDLIEGEEEFKVEKILDAQQRG
jgi:hypothetical protein